MSGKFTKMLRRVRTVTTLGLGLAAGSVWISAASADEIVARLSYHWAPKHHSAIFCQEFADRVNARGEGKIRVETFPSGQLFGIREVMGALTAGSVQLGGVVGTVSFPPVNRNYNVEALPGVFENFDHLRKFFRETEVGQEIWDDVLTRTRTKFLAYNPTGPFMSFTAERPLTSPEAFEGLKARYLSGIERPRWTALGADAVSMPTGEVYTALQNGMIDTFSTVPSAIKAYSWWDHVKYGQLPHQFYADSFILVSQAWFDGLPEDVQQLLIEVGEEISEESTASIMAFSDDVLEEFVSEQGGQVDTLTEEAQAEFERINNEKVLPGLSEMIDPEVLEAVMEYSGQ
ncbi:TRAP transporter substrate-binding protein [uncultured Sulfitobacter sp.]|uniref:TRAP transporter substrate-binding protein n=1 Tax=uncultured Sulfitobacter sp. TaxID=191468 RepID=UPI0026285A18|nr:TRAP transporter substrate-binding protein [uncultured Sulfitobacter sp.]